MPIAKASSMVLKNPRVAGALSGLWPKAVGMMKGPVNYMGQNPGRTQPPNVHYQIKVVAHEPCLMGEDKQGYIIKIINQGSLRSLKAPQVISNLECYNVL